MYECLAKTNCLHVRFDSDKDGVLSVKEVAMVFRSIGCSPTEAELQVRELFFFVKPKSKDPNPPHTSGLDQHSGQRWYWLNRFPRIPHDDEAQGARSESGGGYSGSIQSV